MNAQLRKVHTETFKIPRSVPEGACTSTWVPGQYHIPVLNRKSGNTSMCEKNGQEHSECREMFVDLEDM